MFGSSFSDVWPSWTVQKAGPLGSSNSGLAFDVSAAGRLEHLQFCWQKRAAWT